MELSLKSLKSGRKRPFPSLKRNALTLSPIDSLLSQAQGMEVACSGGQVQVGGAEMSEFQGLQVLVRGFPSEINALLQQKEMVASQEANKRSVYNLFQHKCQNFINLPSPVSPHTRLFREQFQQGERERKSKLWGEGGDMASDPLHFNISNPTSLSLCP